LYTSRQERIGWYAGGKFGLARSSTDFSVSGNFVPSTSQSTNANGYFAGPVFGGEYFLHDRFSLGVTIAFVYDSVDVAVPTGTALLTSTTASQRGFDTQAAIVARIYLRSKVGVTARRSAR